MFGYEKKSKKILQAEKRYKEQQKEKKQTEKKQSKLESLSYLHQPEYVKDHWILKPVSGYSIMTKPWKFMQWWRYREYRLNPHKRICVQMELNNGHHRTFVLVENFEGFKYRDKKYLFDVKSKFWNIDMNMFCYTFHEDICLPIKVELPTDLIKTTLEEVDMSEVAYAINPKTLERFETSKIAEGIMKGQAIDNALKMLFLVLVIVGVLVILILIIVSWKLGVIGEAQI